MDEHPVQGRVVILLVTSCYENQDNLHLGGPIGLSIVQNFYYMYHFTHSENVPVQWLLFICFCIDVDNFFQITNHTQTICPLKVINCPYQYLGCKRKVCTNVSLRGFAQSLISSYMCTSRFRVGACNKKGVQLMTMQDKEITTKIMKSK